MRVSGALLGLAMLAPLVFLGQQVNIEPRAKAREKAGQRQAGTETPVPDIRVDSTLVLIPVAVTDTLGRPVTGLDRDNFRIYEEKVEQKITSISMEDDPIAMGLVFDASGSMGQVLRESSQAAGEFIKHSEPEDEFFLVEFSDVPKLVVPLTTDPAKIQSALTFARSRGSTALLDAVYMAMGEIRKSKRSRKAVIVVSDGGDNSSRYTATEVRNAIRETDVLIYTISVYGSGFDPYAGQLMRNIAEQTGGRMFPAQGVPLAEIAEKIGIDLRTHYVIGYVPQKRTRDGKYHKIEVKLSTPKFLGELRARYRAGYYDD